MIFGCLKASASQVEDFDDHYLHAAEQITLTAEDYFQDQQFDNAFMFYIQAQVLYSCSKNIEDKSMKFRIDVGRELSDAFLNKEIFTMKERLEKVFKELK